MGSSATAATHGGAGRLGVPKPLPLIGAWERHLAKTYYISDTSCIEVEILKIVTENSIKNYMIPTFKKLSEIWNSDVNDVKWVNNILEEPHNNIDFKDEKGEQWKLIFPKEKGVVFIIDFTLHEDMIKSYAGGAIGDEDKLLDKDDNASVVVFPQDSVEILELRFVHEVELHARDLPADDLEIYHSKFLKFYDIVFYEILKLLRRHPEHIPYYQRMYYRWLLEQRTNGLI